MVNPFAAKTIFSLSVGLFMIKQVAISQDLPIDKNATSETVHLYRNLRSVAGKGFLFGHQDDLAYGVGWKDIPGRSDIKDVTGDYPGLYGWELGRIELDHAVNIDNVPFDKMKKYILDGYERGGVITISWHLNNPLTGGTAWEPAPGTVASILPGGEKHALYKSWLDKVAVFLSDLKGKKGEPIPVVLRLFHELTGDWFWWGGSHCSPDEFKQLWHFTVGYLRDEKKLHNLLYAYNTGGFSSEKSFLEKYPGDEWADIVGFDTYQQGKVSSAQFIQELDKALSLLEKIAADKKKIPALMEFGYNGIPDSLWWTGTLLKALHGHKIAYALAWRNAGDKPDGSNEYYAPYPGQLSAADFVRFYQDGSTFFEKDAAKMRLYQ